MLIDEKTQDAIYGILIVGAGVCAGQWMFKISLIVFKFLYGFTVGLMGVLP